MIIVMKPQATDEQFEYALKRVRELGLNPHPILGTELRVIAVVGDERMITPDAFEVLPGVANVMPVLASYKLASAEGRLLMKGHRCSGRNPCSRSKISRPPLPSWRSPPS